MGNKKTTIVTFKALTYDRRMVNKNIPIHHDFEVIPAQKWHGIMLPETSVESQVIEFLDKQDKRELMEKYDFLIIIDYYVRKKKHRKTKQDELNEFMTFLEPYFNAYPSVRRPFEAIISEHKDMLFGKGKSNDIKMEEIINIHRMIMKGVDGMLDMLMKGDWNNNLLDNK